MKHVTIRLADAEGIVLEERTIEGEFASIDDYVDRRWQERSQERLEELLLEGLNSEELEWTPELLDDIRREAGLIQ